MLCQYTDDMNSLFREGIEAEYFRSPAELLEKAKYYLRHESARRRIAEAGHRRVHTDGHDVRDRARFLLDCLSDDLSSQEAVGCV